MQQIKNEKNLSCNVGFVRAVISIENKNFNLTSNGSVFFTIFSNNNDTHLCSFFLLGTLMGRDSLFQNSVRCLTYEKNKTKQKPELLFFRENWQLQTSSINLSPVLSLNNPSAQNKIFSKLLF